MGKHQPKVFLRHLCLFFVSFACLLVTVVRYQEPLYLLDEFAADVNTKNATAVLIYIPGFDVPTEAYVPLVTRLQRELAYNNATLNASILRYPTIMGKPFPPFFGLDSMIQSALQTLVTKNAHIFIGGHSLGAVLAQRLAYRKPEQFDGLLLHSAYVMTKYQDVPLAIPTLTLSGTRDGMNRLTYIAAQHRSLRQVYSTEATYHQQAPSVLIEGMNHMTFVQKDCHERDLETKISPEEALDEIARFSTTFLLRRMNYSVDDTALLNAAARSEERYFRPYIEAECNDTAGYTCALSQRLHLESKMMNIAASHSSHKGTFFFSVPERNHTHLRVKSLDTRAFTWFGRSSVPHAAQTLRCKMASKELLIFGESSQHFDSCSSMNAYMFEQVLHKLADDIKIDYLNAGAQLVFAPDTEYSTETRWLLSDLEMSSTNNHSTTSVRSPRLKTAPSDGKLYCTLMPMSRLFEYIVIDAHRTKE